VQRTVPHHCSAHQSTVSIASRRKREELRRTNCSRLPTSANLEVVAGGEEVVKKLQDGVALLLLETDNMSSKAGVDVAVNERRVSK
jgi:hypothetical protein